MRRIASALLALALLLFVAPCANADMYPDASNAKLPDARYNLGVYPGVVNVQQYGAVPDALRVQCAVTTTAANTAVTIAPGSAMCAFTSADVGKPLVIWNAGSTATAPLATTIAGVTDATHLTVAVAPGQTLAAATQYVSWGTDNAAAIGAAYNQATKQLDPNKNTGTVYFPPAYYTVSTGIYSPKFYGTTQSIGIAPNANRIGTAGASPYRSKVLALAPMAQLVFESAGYADGNTIRDIGYDGNMLATNTGYFACSPNSRLDNVNFDLPAPGGINLKIGATGSGNCPGLVATAVRLDNLLQTDLSQYPAKHIEVNSTDTTWYTPLPSGPVSQYSIHITGTAANATMFQPHTASLAGTAAIFTEASVVFLDDPQIDNGNTGTLTGLIIGGASTRVIAGRQNLPTTNSVGIVVNANVSGVYITGFDCNRFTNPANCIQLNYPIHATTQIFANGATPLTPVAVQKLNQFPTGTTNTAGVLAGLNLTITPKLSTFVTADFQANAANTTAGSGSSVFLKYGTGAAPANGADCTTPGGGSTVVGGGDPLKATSATASAQVPASGRAILTMTPGTTYWVDLCVAAITSGTASIVNADLKLVEQNRW